MYPSFLGHASVYVAWNTQIPADAGKVAGSSFSSSKDHFWTHDCWFVNQHPHKIPTQNGEIAMKSPFLLTFFLSLLPASHHIPSWRSALYHCFRRGSEVANLAVQLLETALVRADFGGQ